MQIGVSLSHHIFLFVVSTLSAKERKRMRSFTTSGTVTDIIAQMEIEEGDPLIHQISRIVRTHERRLKSKISKRHAQFLQSVQVRAVTFPSLR